MSKTYLITGGAGFIGSALCRMIINETNDTIINIDKLTYAGNLESLSLIAKNERFNFEKIDICNSDDITNIFDTWQPDVVINLAAESHVDRSIKKPDSFIQTNIVGTYVLLEGARDYWGSLKGTKRENFRFHHVSTDEVYGDLENDKTLFTEETPYAPSSPYSASKASSDHLVRAWQRTYGLPTLITNCSNNYGPFQFPEKLIPVIILNALQLKKIPVYGDGNQIRDWLYVEDHVRALIAVANQGALGATYNIGGYNEIKNIEVVRLICSILDKIKPLKNKNIKKYEELIEFIEDRAGHDIRYAIDASKISKELSWFPKETFITGIEKTIRWYLKNLNWSSQFLNLNLEFDNTNKEIL